MMADGADAGAAWENPLIPNARLRQIYLAMTRVRMLARALPAGRGKATLGLEACLVSAAVDLGPSDLVSDGLVGGVVEFLRGATLGEVLRPGAAKKKRGPLANGGEAARLAMAPGIAERMWAALGAAAGLKAAAARAKAEAQPKGVTAEQAGVVVVFALPEQVPTVLWRKALTFAHEEELPVLFVVLPGKRGKALGRVSALALRCGVPGIPVDADDAVAIYRVAQESIGHARIGGGAALMECLPFVVSGTAGKAADAIAGLEGYLVERKVATRSWIDGEARSFAKRLAIESAASK
jgi:TPP-dependent pyruvate/acetoin dehydrogenase alpha subunit